MYSKVSAVNLKCFQLYFIIDFKLRKRHGKVEITNGKNRKKISQLIIISLNRMKMKF